MVELVHSIRRGQFDRVKVRPRTPVNHLGFVRSVDGLRWRAVAKGGRSCGHRARCRSRPDAPQQWGQTAGSGACRENRSKAVSRFAGLSTPRAERGPCVSTSPRKSCGVFAEAHAGRSVGHHAGNFDTTYSDAFAVMWPSSQAVRFSPVGSPTKVRHPSAVHRISNGEM